MIPACEREQDVTRLVLTHRWPAAADMDLRRHAAACEVCSDALLVADVLARDRDQLTREVRVPASGQVWWRAALRAHAEAAAAARRPLIWLQGLAGACAVAVVAALVTAAWPSISEAAEAVLSLRSDAAPLIAAVRPVLPVALAAVACLVLTPLLVYLALLDD